MDRIKKVAFVYLSQGSGEYYVTDDPGYDIQRRPQLGLQYLCAVLEKKGIETNIFDQTVDSFDLDWLVEKLKEYDIAGFYCSDTQEDKVKAYCKEIKEKLAMPVLVGGPSTLDNPSFLDHGCDIVVYGEGEITLEEIIEYYNGHKRLEDIRGIFYKKDGKIVQAPPQALIRDLDELPFPDRSKTDINLYYDYFLFGMKRPYVTMMAARGCFYRCSFCTSCNLWGNKYRKRSADNVLSEIDDAVKRYRIRYIAFQDDVFGISNDWIEEFSKKLTERRYKIRWMPILHPLSLKTDTEKILVLMKKAGCDALSFGLQSAHPQILKNINRNPSEPQRLKNIIKAANKVRLLTAVSYIFGLPGDTRKTIQTTIDYSLNCGATLSNYFILSVLRGSEMEKVYRGKKVCDMDDKEIQNLTIYASRKFYTDSASILRIAYYVMKNPEWVLRRGISIPSVLTRVGFFKPKK
ncbi:MAG: B12-binding domain-containing radical SAM protein [Candidatus Omnitrophica bacterium]|nr:B12-binding domain-containing radical SAM protein [Candidatus Omnitrophota bacterium]MBU4590202.1 B12-binding domain-containing radical SAM protein [Candidatus Omnitrophota bacterium]